jgi:hypothetical protein
MKEKSKIYLFIQIIIGVVIAHLILTKLAPFMGLRNEPPIKIPKNQMAQTEATELLVGLPNGLQGYHMETGSFPENYGVAIQKTTYHSMEISLLDKNTVVFKILPKISDLYAFSGMMLYDAKGMQGFRIPENYQSIICQSEQFSQAINFPEVISQCPSNTRIMER